MAKYTKIIESEFDALLKTEKGWVKTEPAKSKEFVYEWRTAIENGHIAIKVYSSISVTTGECRTVGSDAIRVCAVLEGQGESTKGLVKVKRVHRVENWRKNLRKRIETVLHTAKSRVLWTCNVEWLADQVADDAEAEAVNGESAAQASAVEECGESENEPCDKCGGTGVYVWGAIVNGKPTKSGKCFACGGKGYQDAADKKRNAHYWNHYFVAC